MVPFAADLQETLEEVKRKHAAKLADAQAEYQALARRLTAEQEKSEVHAEVRHAVEPPQSAPRLSAGHNAGCKRRLLAERRKATRQVLHHSFI